MIDLKQKHANEEKEKQDQLVKDIAGARKKKKNLQNEIERLNNIRNQVENKIKK